MSDLGKSLRDGALLAALAAAPLGLPLLALRAGFERPTGLALYGLAVPLVALHILKPRRVRKTVGSVLLWREVERTLEARHPFQRLRRNLPLFLELLALAALAVALAGPRFHARTGSGQNLVLVIDASASMKTRDGPAGVSRFEQARAEARALLAGLHAGEHALVIAATPRGARTVQGWTDDRAALEDALAGLACTDGPADLGDALVLAAAATPPQGGRGDVVLFSDGGGPPVPALDFKGKLRYRALGSTGENVGIVAVELAPAEAGAGPDARPGRPYSVLVSILNAGALDRKVWVELRPSVASGRESGPIAARRLDLAPRSRAAIVLEARLEPGPVLARLSPAPGDPSLARPGGALDLLPEDDEAALVVPGDDAVVVALVSKEGSRSLPALERALAAAAHVRVERRSLDAIEDTALRLVVLDGVLPPKLPRTSCLVIDPPGPVGPVGLGELVTAPSIDAWDRDDRLLRYVSLEDVAIARAHALVLGASARALMTSDRGPLIAAFAEGDAGRVVLGFDVAATSWPLRLSFPIFVRNAVLAAIEDEAQGPRGTVRAGSIVSLRAPPGVTRVLVTPPAHAGSLAGEIAVPVEDERALFSGTDQAGLYRVRVGERESAFAVATLDEGETRVEPRPVLALGADPVASQPALEGGEREVAWPFLMLALTAATLEGFAFGRRW